MLSWIVILIFRLIFDQMYLLFKVNLRWTSGLGQGSCETLVFELSGSSLRSQLLDLKAAILFYDAD